jgi:hypothetical protein
LRARREVTKAAEKKANNMPAVACFREVVAWVAENCADAIPSFFDSADALATNLVEWGNVQRVVAGGFVGKANALKAERLRGKAERLEAIRREEIEAQRLATENRREAERLAREAEEAAEKAERDAKFQAQIEAGREANAEESARAQRLAEAAPDNSGKVKLPI